MKNKLFEYLNQDAMAGIVTGLMAIPLTVGICIMSKFPIIVGFYTVIFACIIGFISYLFKPGNYVGTPGVAAGLAPALAMGVAEFGTDNMPFLIFLTALFQAIVWSFNLQKYILKIVPSYLIEGLLAGVGIKIANNFIPYTYSIVEQSDHFFSYQRIILLILSLVTLIIFVILYQRFSKVSPGLPYIITITLGFISMFFIKLPVIVVDDYTLKIRVPFPSNLLENKDSYIILIKMIGFSLMLGTIDVIEQVMSNAAIEELDPLKRKCDTNNSLFAIWIANMGSSFFGGMTNLDGLAKSSTNAFAGAHTKLSNLFTAGVLSIVIIFPSLLSYLPEYTLGVIMIFTAWKMIIGLLKVPIEHGKYELSLSILCSILVFKLGIFEGLIISLLTHLFIIILSVIGRKEPINKIWENFHT